MRPWTAVELKLAVKLTSRHGYDFDHAAEIMSRHGYAGRSAEDVKDKIREDAPDAWARISESYDARQSVKIDGVPAPAPKRRFQAMPDNFVEFVSRIRPGLTDGEACWAARLAGFNCNVTDIRIAAKRSNYKFADPQHDPIEYRDAMDKDLCLWPIDKLACGAARKRGKYCGPHHCRSLGGDKGY